MADRFTFEVACSAWHFRPHSKKGRAWLRDNLFNPKCHSVPRRDGPMTWRALRAEGFELVPVNGADDPTLPEEPKTKSGRPISIFTWAHRFTGDLEKVMLRVIVSVVFCVKVVRFGLDAL